MTHSLKAATISPSSKYINRKRIFHNAFISRCYMMFADKTQCAFYFKLIHYRHAIIIYFSIRRILAPNTNAFDHYDAIMKIVQKYSPNEYLILLALGPTATVMAYNLAQKGYQAIDIGHIDIEYEWYRMGASHKVPIPSKYVNEADAGVGVGDIHDEKYKKEIICRF